MAYTRVNWENLPSTNTPVNATNLNKMDAGIKDLDTNLNPSSWTRASINNNVMSQGGFYYAKFGKLVVIDIEDAIASSDISTNRTVIASGFPKAQRQINFALSRVNSTTTDNVCRVAIDTDGNLILWYDTMFSGAGKEYYGQVFYITSQ